MSQLDLFGMMVEVEVADPEQVADVYTSAILPKEETISYQEATPQERKLMELLAETMAWAMTHPITVSKTSGMDGKEMQDLAQRHKGAIELERWARVMRFWKDRPGEDASAEDVREFMRQGKDLMARITDREVCLIMSDLSSIAPLNDECAHEYFRAFAATFGVEQFVKIQAQWFEPININHCEMLRYGEPKVRDTFPLLDREWIERFNREARAAFEARNQEAAGLPVPCELAVA